MRSPRLQPLTPPTGTVIVGAGPAGMGPLIAARAENRLDQLLDHGLVILDRGQHIGAGALGGYAIRSDSFADSFLGATASAAQPDFSALLCQGPGAQLDSLRGGPVALKTAGEFLGQLGASLRHWLQTCRYDPFITGATALRARRQHDGGWLTEYQLSDGTARSQRSQHLVLASGAAQSVAALERATVADLPLQARFGAKVILSDQALGHDGARLLANRLAGVARPKVVVVGGSHSAMSSALVCLRHWDALGVAEGSVAILHRRPFRITYQTPEIAHAEGYHDFGDQDICARSGRVYPLAGMRSDSRQLLRRYWGLGDAAPEPRLQLLQLTSGNQPQAAGLLAQADLIIAATGYLPRALPLYDSHGRRIALRGDTPGAALVDEHSRVLDAAARPLPGVYALGLSAGYPMAGVHGEPSFQGQANGLSLWHGAIGAGIVAQLLAQHSTQSDERLIA